MRRVSGAEAAVVMVASASRKFDGAAAVSSGPRVAPRTAQRMACVREAFRLSRRAKTQRRLWSFYMEHNLLEEARDARVLMLDLLRSAGQQWRLTLAGAI